MNTTHEVLGHSTRTPHRTRRMAGPATHRSIVFATVLSSFALGACTSTAIVEPRGTSTDGGPGGTPKGATGHDASAASDRGETMETAPAAIGAPAQDDDAAAHVRHSQPGCRQLRPDITAERERRAITSTQRILTVARRSPEPPGPTFVCRDDKARGETSRTPKTPGIGLEEVSNFGSPTSSTSASPLLRACTGSFSVPQLSDPGVFGVLAVSPPETIQSSASSY